MPRPKSELTATTQKRIGVRLTLWHYDEWNRLGGHGAGLVVAGKKGAGLAGEEDGVVFKFERGR